MSYLSNREINLYLKIKVPMSLKSNKIKDFLLEEYKKVNWNKPGCKLYYNFYVIHKLLDFNIEYFIDNDNAFILIENIKIPIRLQDYFHYKLITKIKKSKYTKDWFDQDGFLNDEIVTIERRVKTNINKIYRTDNEIQICNNNYLCIEFFESHHENFDDLEYQKERSRIYNIYHNCDDDKKYIHFAIFWQKYINDEKYWNTFIKHLINIIKNYKYINDEKIWCIKSMNEFTNNELLSTFLYDMFNDKNKPILSLNDIDNIFELIKWKDKNSKKLYYSNFINYIQQIQLNNKKNINDNDLDFLEENNNDIDIKEHKVYIQDKKLTYYGFIRYISNIDISYLNSINDKELLIQFNENITTGFINGIKQRYQLINNLKEQLIFGL